MSDEILNRYAKGLARNVKYIGAKIPVDMSSHLTLIALNEQTTVSDIIISLLIEYIEANLSKEEVITEIAKKCIIDWNIWFDANEGSDGWKTWEQVSDHFDVFKNETKRTLKTKRIPFRETQLIIDEMERIETGSPGDPLEIE